VFKEIKIKKTETIKIKIIEEYNNVPHLPPED